MQGRASPTPVDEPGGGVLKHGGVRTVKEWSGSLPKVFLIFLVLAAGVVVGVVTSFHLMGVLRTGLLSSYMNGAAPAQQHVHLHVIAPQDYQSLHHGMGDEELLWRASMVPTRPGMPIRRTPKVAFMFLTVGRMPLAPLWEKFFKGQQHLYNIYVHSLPQYEPKEQPSSVFFGRHIFSRDTKWGDISMCDAERRLLATALLDFENERFVLLSESCVPLWNFTFTYNYLIHSQKSFVGVFDDPGPVGRGRYNPALLPEITIEQWRKGAQWFEVNRELAIYIIADVKYYEKFRNFCQPPCYVDEHYIPTMMFIEFGGKIAMRSVTAVDWSRGGSHPSIFGKNDAEDFYRRIRSDSSCTYNGTPNNVCYLFARKFAPDSLQPLISTAALRKLLKK